MQGKLVTIFGGSGFLGRYVAQALLNEGARIRVACRNVGGANHIKPLGNVGQVQLMAADVRKPDSVARAVMDADAVINLVGSFDNMDAVQNVGAGIVAQAAAAAQIHIHRPARGFQISLERCDQRINTWIQNRTAVRVHDFVAAAPVIARTQLAFRGALQGDQGPVAVAQGAGGAEDGQHLDLEMANALERLTHQIGLQFSLSGISAVLQGASPTTLRKDAGGLASIG